VYAAKRDLDRAIADHSEAIRLAPKNAERYSNRGIEYYGKGEFDSAIADLNEASVATAPIVTGSM
jgi:Flp pilus assembly protein TadD